MTKDIYGGHIRDIREAFIGIDGVRKEDERSEKRLAILGFILIVSAILLSAKLAIVPWEL